MAKLNPNQNPFQDTDFLTQVIEQDVQIQNQSKQAFRSFITKYHPKPQTLTFMSRIFKTISTHSTAFVIGLVLAGSAFGVSAAQITAPEQYKPSTIFNELFKANKQVEKNPYTALKPDTNNDVVKIDECDLAIKYPKMIKDVKVDSFEIDPEYFFNKATFGVSLNTLPDLNKAYAEQKQITTFNIQCSTTNPILPENEVVYEVVKPDVLQKLTGWFIFAESNINPIRTLKPYKGVKSPFSSYFFEYNKKFYEVTVSTEEIIKAQGYDQGYSEELINAGGIYADQVQIQFNSLVDNEANTKPKPAIKPIKNDNKQGIDIKLKNESKFVKITNNKEEKGYGGIEDVQTCGVPNAIIYKTGEKGIFNQGEESMIIGNKKDYINDKNLNNSYNRVVTYLNNPKDTLTDTLTSGFISYCYGGAYSNYLADLSDINYPNTDKFKAVLTREGQSKIGDAVVRVYAKKGDNIISLVKRMTTEVEQKTAFDNYNLLCEQGNPDSQLQADIDCRKKGDSYIEKYNANQVTPAKIAEAKIEAQKLVDMFAIQ